MALLSLTSDFLIPDNPDRPCPPIAGKYVVDLVPSGRLTLQTFEEIQYHEGKEFIAKVGSFACNGCNRSCQNATMPLTDPLGVYELERLGVKPPAEIDQLALERPTQGLTGVLTPLKPLVTVVETQL